MKIGFIGLGKLGLPVAEVMAEKYPVFGYDIKKIQTNSINICDSVKDLVDQTKIIFIAVQTPHELGYGGESPNSHLTKKDFDYRFIEDTLNDINPHLTENQIVVIISTVLPGTVRNRFSKLLSKGDLIYNPYLIAMGTVKADFLKPEMVIIGTKDGKVENHKLLILKKLYENLLATNTRYEIGTWEEAESIKIFYNTFISAKIAIVNMIQDVAQSIGNMNVDIVTNALSKSDKRITSAAYMKAGMGDGGPCHPRDNIALSWLAQKMDLKYDIFHAINVSREQQALNIAQKLASLKNPVVILGTNYKPNTTLIDGSYGLLVNSYLQSMHVATYLDTNPPTAEIYTYLICHENTYLDFPFYKNSIIFDPWRSFKTERTDLSIYYYGNTRI
jgi:UDPglucose 6-dehydrogenase